MWLPHFLDNLKLTEEGAIDLEGYYNKIDCSESICLYVAYNFKLNPSDVEKWSMERLLKTYAFLKSRKEGE